jgi:hypothetical protein
MPKSFLENQAAMLKGTSSALAAQQNALASQTKMPSEEQNLIDLYSGMRESVGYASRPRSKWRAFIDGAFRGFEFGEKQNMTKKMKEKYEMLERNLEYHQQLADYSNKILEQEQKKEMIKQEVSQFTDPIYQASINGASRQDVDDMGRLAFRALQDKGIVPDGSAFIGIDPQTMTAIYQNPSNERSFVNLTPYVTSDGMEAAKQKIDNLSAQARMRSADASMIRANTESSPLSQEAKQAYITNAKFNTNPEERGNRAAFEAQGKMNAKHIAEIQPKIESVDTLVSNLNDIERIIKESQLAGKSPLKSVFRFLARNSGFDGAYSEDRMRMLLRSQFGKLSDVLGPGVKSDTDMKVFEEGMIGLDKDKTAVLEQIAFDKALAKNKANLYRQQIYKYEQNKTANLHSNTADLTKPGSVPEANQLQQSANAQMENQNQGMKTITLFDPETGVAQTKQVPESQYDVALQKAKGLGLVVASDAR